MLLLTSCPCRDVAAIADCDSLNVTSVKVSVTLQCIKLQWWKEEEEREREEVNEERVKESIG